MISCLLFHCAYSVPHWVNNQKKELDYAIEKERTRDKLIYSNFILGTYPKVRKFCLAHLKKRNRCVFC